MSNPQKRKGTVWENAVTDYLRRRLDDERIDRLTIGGTNDRGDVSNVYAHGRRVAIEAKNHARLEIPKWLQEAEDERCNYDALAGVVVIKRRGIGMTPSRMPEQLVAMTLEDFCALITGTREDQ